MKGYKGVVVADGYVVYRSLAQECGYTLAHDWTHVRRRFIEAEATAAEQATRFIENIDRLFVIERDIKASTKGLAEQEARAVALDMRQKQSKPIVEEIGKNATLIRALKDSPIGRALTSPTAGKACRSS